MMRQLIAVVSMVIFVMFTATSAQARHHKHHHHRVQLVTVNPYIHCDDRYPASCGVVHRTKIERHTRIASDTSERIVSHPSGCPGRAFCGCGVSVKVFGHPVRDLYLAANWRRFPSASPAPGMVAYRSHHVMYIESYDGNGNAVVYDPNSGGHQTRVHVRSLAGYRVVNPHGSRMAMQ
jgi:hypothetical protein